MNRDTPCISEGKRPWRLRYNLSVANRKTKRVGSGIWTVWKQQLGVRLSQVGITVLRLRRANDLFEFAVAAEPTVRVATEMQLLRACAGQSIEERLTLVGFLCSQDEKSQRECFSSCRPLQKTGVY